MLLFLSTIMSYTYILTGISNRFPALTRCYHKTQSCYAPDKQLLSKLRKLTGFSFVNCRQALEKFDYDLKEAEAWLRDRAQKEGWAKASKLQSRPMSQGLIGIAAQDKAAAIVEVNCETDFVARNVRFQSLVSAVANACLQHGISSNSNKVLLDLVTIGSLRVDDKSIADMTALEVGNVGENIAVRRAVYLSAAGANQHLASYIHSTGAHQGACVLGKYGSLVLCETITPSDSTILDENALPVDELCRRLCQHVVGMNPRSLGSPTETESPSNSAEEETRLLFQEYMHDTSLTVSDVLQQTGARVLDFVRLECGETQHDS